VILVDANLLIYAHVSSFPQHTQARDWLDGQLSGRARVGLPWPSLLGFLRIVTNPRVFQRPESITEA
jgi:predicted nucleic acid-binding protein